MKICINRIVLYTLFSSDLIQIFDNKNPIYQDSLFPPYNRMKLLHLVAVDKDNTHTNNISNMSGTPDQNTNTNPNTTPNSGNTTITPPADINMLIAALQHLAVAKTPTPGRSSSTTTPSTRLSPVKNNIWDYSGISQEFKKKSGKKSRNKTLMKFKNQ